MIFSWYRALKDKGILSINQRNADFILPYNSRKLYPLVDDKLKTKQLAIDAGIAVPTLYATVENEHQAAEIEKTLAAYDDFVIKPAHGAGGDGILVITAKVRDKFRKANGQLLTIDDIKYHLSCTLSGAYSLSGYPDRALIERRVIVDNVFETISHQGVPDLRLIVFLGYPLMAMVRLPTQQSDGKANLHQGAIGVGIDLVSGKTMGGVHHNETIDIHPDTLNNIAGIQVPNWDTILKMASHFYDLTELGYLGVDIVLDKHQGPLMLELNARPGLNIQIANRTGLVKRFEQARKRASEFDDSLQDKIDFIKREWKNVN